ncbi:MAG: cupin domain-containing protein [Gemmatimonadales bacterium]
MRIGGWWLLGVFVVGGCRGAAGAAARPAEVQAVLTHALPSLHAAEPRVQVLEVRYPPGGASEPHRHPCAVVGYVTAGELRSAVGDGPERVYHTGQSFYEAPNELHRVSANASRDVPARFIATFICDSAPPPVPAAPAPLTPHRGALE